MRELTYLPTESARRSEVYSSSGTSRYWYTPPFWNSTSSRWRSGSYPRLARLEESTRLLCIFPSGAAVGPRHHARQERVHSVHVPYHAVPSVHFLGSDAPRLAPETLCGGPGGQ